MEFFRKTTKIPFMDLSRYTAIFSVLLMLWAVGTLWVKGLHFGLDFTGGTQIELRYPGAVSVDEVRDALRQLGYEQAKVTHYGSPQDLLVRFSHAAQSNDNEVAKQMWLGLEKVSSQSIELRRVEFVGAEVGKNLSQKGALAVLIAILGTMVYIGLRFEFRLAVSAAIALLHDPIMILGVFSALQLEFDLATVAAILSVVGYSLNDTIVVFDRVRENFRTVRGASPREIMDLSINQTLSRTIMTSFLTLLVVLALFFFGGESLHGFATALVVGIVIGTYSSIYIAGALALKLGLNQADLMPKPKLVDHNP